MKLRDKILLLVIFLSVGIRFTSCKEPNHKVKVHTYKKANPAGAATASTDDDWLYYYVIWGNNNSTAYYYTSSIPVTDFQTLNFVYTENPISAIDIADMVDESTFSISESSLSSSVQSEMQANESEFSEATEVNDNAAEAEQGEGNSDSDSDSGSDSGSDGGSDGGGDGGGGGD